MVLPTPPLSAPTRMTAGLLINTPEFGASCDPPHVCRMMRMSGDPSTHAGLGKVDRSPSLAPDRFKHAAKCRHVTHLSPDGWSCTMARCPRPVDIRSPLADQELRRVCINFMKLLFRTTRRHAITTGSSNSARQFSEQECVSGCRRLAHLLPPWVALSEAPRAADNSKGVGGHAPPARSNPTARLELL